MQPEPQWYALVVRPRSEKAVAQALANRGVEQYLPVYRGRYRSAGRIKDVDLPLLPEYVFCIIGPRDRGYVLSTPGVFRFVAFGNQPAPVDPAELHSIRRIAESGMDSQPWPFLKPRDYVEIVEGPLRGIVGRLIEAKGDCKLIVDVSLLQRSISIVIDRGWVRPCQAFPVSAQTVSRCAFSKIA
jgi:transcriptional antiterminator NusG